MSDLKPCPFCGEAEHLYPAYRNMGAGKPYAIDCIGCGMDFVPRDGMDVVAMWNRRAGSEPAPEITRLREIIENARQAFAETHSDDEARCRAMAAHLSEVDAS